MSHMQVQRFGIGRGSKWATETLGTPLLLVRIIGRSLAQPSRIIKPVGTLSTLINTLYARGDGVRLRRLARKVPRKVHKSTTLKQETLRYLLGVASRALSGLWPYIQAYWPGNVTHPIFHFRTVSELTR